MNKLRLGCAAAALILATSLGGCTPPAPPKPPVDTAKIAEAGKAGQAQLLADYNAHDATKVASHDAADVVQMAHGAANIVGAVTDLEANKQAFAAVPAGHVTIANESADAPASRNLAV